MSGRKVVPSKRPRDKYSRLICVGCRDRRIRCELPPGVEIPNPGEFRTIQTPCYRCERLGIPCVVRQTILGRPSTDSHPTPPAEVEHTGIGDIVSRIVIELPFRTAAHHLPATGRHRTDSPGSEVVPWATSRSAGDAIANRVDPLRLAGNALLVHTPQSTETVIIIRALDTLRCEKVEDEWFRHLPAHVGHTKALDLSIKAIVAACAYSRGVPKLDSFDCYQALSHALNAVQADIKHSSGNLNDDILASTALLAPFEGALRNHGISTRSHVEGLGAMLSSRPPNCQVTQLARDILDFYACESAIMACVQGVPSPFEGIAQGYFANDGMRSADWDRAQLKALANELSIRLPRLVMAVRCLRNQTTPQNQILLEALTISKSLMALQDSQAESRLMKKVKVQPSNEPNADSPLRQCLNFASVRDYEALASYWQNRLWLLKLARQLHDLVTPSKQQAGSKNKPESALSPEFGPQSNEIEELSRSIVMCLEYAGTLPLRKHDHLIAHAIMVVWDVMRQEQPETLIHGIDRESHLSCFLLRKINAALEGRPDLAVEDMSTAGDIFNGGSLMGKFAEFYGLVRTG